MSARLVHYRASAGNVGDDFSEWLFARCLGAGLQPEGTDLLYGVGSILDTRFDKAFAGETTRTRRVFGSDARSAQSLPDMTAGAWKIYCVRGPLTAAALDLSPDRGVADPAILAPRLLPAQVDPAGPIGVVPYFTASEAVWAQVVTRLGWQMISPRQPVETFIAALTRCSRVFCESMHGAIFADAYRIPWRPLSGTGAQAEGATHAFKWTDWTASMGIGFDRIMTPPISAFAATHPVGRAKAWLKAGMISRTLAAEARRDRFLLSRDSVLAARQDRLEALMEELRRDLAAET